MLKLSKLFKYRLINWLVFLYIFFIPLWPKLPFQTVGYTYIAIRYEDLFVALLVLVFLFELVRGKVKLKDNPLFKPIVFYWLVVFVSFLFGFYILRTIKTLELGFLNSARRVEYMIVFFIAFATLQKKEQFLLYLKSIFLVLALVSLYGIGQKFFGWPAVQTMNPHYAKGLLLTLDANARISSTFGGHYDLAAYLVVLFPLVLAAFAVSGKVHYFLLFAISLLALILTASRVSYIAYAVSAGAFLLFIRRPKLLLAVILLTVLLTPLSENLTKRIKRTFREEYVWYNPQTGSAIVPREIRADDLPPGDLVVSKKETEVLPPQKISSKEAQLVKNQIRDKIVEEAAKTGKKLTEAEIQVLVNDVFNKLQPAKSVVTDISFATRLQVEWPRAVMAFIKNPLSGTGPSSITEATDNFLSRALGETGILGFTAFFFIIAKLQFLFWTAARRLSEKGRILFLGVIFGVAGLLINALYIDVFEASKIAFFIWFLWGLMLKLTTFNKREIETVAAKI